jgi:hypothetical protein
MSILYTIITIITATSKRLNPGGGSAIDLASKSLPDGDACADSLFQAASACPARKPVDTGGVSS